VLLEVADTGPGIPEADTEGVFEAFRQMGASSTRGTNGVGLGLSIVRQLAEALGGRVTLSSRVGFGSTFTITLPVRAPASAEGSAGPATPAHEIQIETESRSTAVAEPLRQRPKRAARGA
jgi:K+-sensing histidine kinase KdpD